MEFWQAEKKSIKLAYPLEKKRILGADNNLKNVFNKIYMNVGI